MNFEQGEEGRGMGGGGGERERERERELQGLFNTCAAISRVSEQRAVRGLNQLGCHHNG